MKRLNFSLYPESIRRILREAGAEADAAGVRAYLVGGAVRDLILGAVSTDIDVVVEGDGIAFARRLEAVWKAKALFHEKFRTAALTLKEGRVVDVVTARRETYARSGALPDVVPATLKEDLARRDFTINAMALALNTPEAGKLRDDLGGARDLDAKLIRIMHEKSFTDDPTRILRAARYAVRFGFQFEALTQDCLDQAVIADVFKTITPARYFLELRRILEEKDPVPAMDLLASWGAVRYVPYEAEDRARLAASAGDWTDRLGGLLDKTPVDAAREILTAFNVSRSAQKKIVQKNT